MLRPGHQQNFLQSRVNMPTQLGHAELTGIDDRIKAQSFFSARVAESHILDRLRSVSDAYSRGDMSLGEARNVLKDFLRGQGYDPHNKALKNLASTARLNLVLKQNAAMAHAAGEWARMRSPAAMKVFPYVRYHARNDGRTRSEHADLDGKIFRKDDPYLQTHTPPWEFNCRCYLEEITEKEAGKEPDKVQEPTPQDEVKVDSKSGFVFNPEHAFEQFDLGSIKGLELRRKTYAAMAESAKKTDAPTTLLAAPAKPVPTVASLENLDGIKQALAGVKSAVDSRAEGEPYSFPEINCSLGRIARERFDAIGMSPEENVEVVFESPGRSDYGMAHWRKHHIDDWKKPDAVEYMLNLMAQTLWNPEAVMAVSLGKGKRITLTSPDGRYLANLWKRGDRWVYSIMDVWDQGSSKSKN